MSRTSHRDGAPPETAQGVTLRAAPISVVVWFGERALGPSPRRDAAQGLAHALGLVATDHGCVEGAALLGASGDGPAVERLLAGLALRGAEIVAAPSVHADTTRRTVLVFMIE